MIRPTTSWYRWNTKDKKWQYNHFEFGICNDEQPTPQSEEQQQWNNCMWAKKFGFYQNALGRTKLTEETNLIITK